MMEKKQESSDFLGKILSVIGKTTVEQVCELLRQSRMSIAVAESLTGGLISERLTTLAGSTDYFVGGVVCYSNRSKVTEVGVPAKVIAEHGAVSKETVLSLAENIRKRLKADIGLAATGYAGPGTGGEKGPVGLTYIAVASSHGSEWKELNLSGSRGEIREQAAQAALGLLWFHLGGEK